MILHTYNLHISNFYIDDLCSGRFIGLPIISQWGGGGSGGSSFFTNTHCNSKLYRGWHHMIILAHLYAYAIHVDFEVTLRLRDQLSQMLTKSTSFVFKILQEVDI